MTAVVSVATFEKVFMRKSISIATLKRTIKNSNIRLNANLSADAKQTEINRIQGAANAIKKRGTFSEKIAAKVAHKENKKNLDVRTYINNHKTVVAVGALALLLIGLVVK